MNFLSIGRSRDEHNDVVEQEIVEEEVREVPEDEQPGDARLRKRTRLALILVGVLIFGFFGLSAILTVGGAVIGAGEISVDTSTKTISHPTGGIISAVLVREGDRVRAGQELMRFDTAVSQVGAQSSATGLEQLKARQARLQAERDGSGSIRMPAELTASDSPEVREAVAREMRLFALRRQERTGALSLLGERVRQYESQVASYQAQIDAIDQQMVLIKPELDGLRKLYEKQLVTINRINQMERTAVQLEGSKAALQSNIAEARGRISETREQMFNVDKQSRSEAGNELAQVTLQLNDQEVRSASATDTYQRSVIRAPQSGIIDKIAFKTVGSAIPPAEPIIQLVPDEDLLLVTARVRPQDVDQLRVGQLSRVTLSALDQQTTPQVAGKLIFVSPDLAHDQATGASYFRIRVQIDEADLKRNKIVLKAGMPAEVFVQTGDRSILSFLLKPLFDQLRYAFREG